MIYTVTLNPALDKTARIDGFAVDGVNRIASFRTDPGGKGINVSKVIAKMGGTSRALALLGGTTGRSVEAMATRLGVDCWTFDAPAETRTNLKIVDPTLHTNTDINEAGPRVDAALLGAMLDQLAGAVGQNDLVVLAGSLPQGAAANTYQRWTEALQARGARVFLDAEGMALIAGMQACPFLIKPNNYELEAIMGRELPTTHDLLMAAEQIVEDGVRNVVVSLGAKGALFVLEDTLLLAHAPKVPVSSTVGAGDSVVAALVMAFEQGLDPQETARLAVATGSANVMSVGTQAAELEAVRSLMQAVKIEVLSRG